MKTPDSQGLHGIPALHCGRDFSPDADQQTRTTGLLSWTPRHMRMYLPGLPRPRRMSLAVGQDEAPYPADVGLLGAQAVMPKPQPATHLLQQPRRLMRRYGFIVMGVTHTPARTSDNVASMAHGAAATIRQVIDAS
ncbi:hypothetical protein J7357_04725 [Xanthomonas sp. D-109]|nr:hypothetical protein [Xanthomonas sp. D-109]